MTKNTQLYYLIKSLNKAEKRHFKLFANKYTIEKDAKYIILFNNIEKQKIYNEKKIKKILKKENLNIKNLSSDKNYLFNLILDSLVYLHKIDNSNSKVKHNILKIELLFIKGLKNEALLLLHKTKEIAKKQNQHFNLLDILRLERELFVRDYYLTDRDKLFKSIENEEFRTIALYQNELQYKALSNKLYNFISKLIRPRTKNEIETLNEIIHHPLLKNTDQATTLVSKMYYYNIKASCNYIAYDYQKSYKLSKSLLELFKKNKSLRKTHNFKYAVAFRNCVLYACLNKEDDALNLLNKFNSFKVKYLLFSDFAIKYISEQSAYLFLIYYITINDFNNAHKAGLQYIKKIKKNPYSIETNTRFNVLARLTSLYMNNNKFEDAHEICNLIINDPEIVKKPGLYTISKVLNLFIHFEKGNFNLLDYLIKSTYAFLIKKNQYHGYEKSCVSRLRKLIKCKNNKFLKENFQDFYNEMTLHAKDPHEKVYFEYFNVLDWIKLHIDKISVGSSE